ncbi:MAG: hypothetical protein KatS3mg032_0001 [Cyclobacteriaceae bacterium]|nr:MAG: hypothetical protein KatS3mg032_0001 [Cyclobacteriaceae bacterium]
MKGCVVLDLDGTLLDCRKRLYTVFSELTGGLNLTEEQYWELKRNKNDHRKILSVLGTWSNQQITEFEHSWLSRIEEKEYLTLDRTFEGVEPFLQRLHQQFYVVLLTSRQLAENVIWQLKYLDLHPWFHEVRITGKGNTKYKTIQERPLKGLHPTYLIGDTGEDIRTARKAGFTAIAVTNGFRSQQVLETYCPDMLLSSVIEFNVLT